MVAAELHQVQREREAMSKMIKKLERAKGDMEGRLQNAHDEAQVLKVEKDVATKRVTEVEQEREALGVKLSQIGKTRGDIETRMKEAEEETNQLKAEKKFKTKEIRDMRASEHSRSIIFQAEDERKNITQNLKKISEEKGQMRAMMAQLDSSRHRLQDLMDDPEDIEDEMSINMTPQSTGMYGSQANQCDPYSVYAQPQSRPVGYSHQPSKAMGGMPMPDNMGIQNQQEQPRQRMARRASSAALHHDDYGMTQEQIQYQQEQPRQRMARRASSAALHHDDYGMTQEQIQYQPQYQQEQPQYQQEQPQYQQEQPQYQQEQRPPPQRVVRRNSSATLQHMGYDMDQEEMPQEERPSGWLGHAISNRSFSDLNAVMDPNPRGGGQQEKSRRRDPDTHSRQSETQEAAYESQNLRSKREKARSSERRLRQEMDRSRSNGSMDEDDGMMDRSAHRSRRGEKSRTSDRKGAKRSSSKRSMGDERSVGLSVSGHYR
jgi:hypothetical protein